MCYGHLVRDSRVIIALSQYIRGVSMGNEDIRWIQRFNNY